MFILWPYSVIWQINTISDHKCSDIFSKIDSQLIYCVTEHGWRLFSMGECVITVCICYCGHLLSYRKILPFLIEHRVVFFFDSLVSSMTMWLGIAATSYFNENVVNRFCCFWEIWSNEALEFVYFVCLISFIFETYSTNPYERWNMEARSKVKKGSSLNSYTFVAREM